MNWQIIFGGEVIPVYTILMVISYFITGKFYRKGEMPPALGVLLKKDLEKLYEFWKNNRILGGALVSVFYDRVVPKSKRIKTLLSKGSEMSNTSIKGAKFSEIGNEHIITHFISLETIKKNIEKLEKAIFTMNRCFNNYIDNKGLKRVEDYVNIIKKADFLKQSLLIL